MAMRQRIFVLRLVNASPAPQLLRGATRTDARLVDLGHDLRRSRLDRLKTSGVEVREGEIWPGNKGCIVGWESFPARDRRHNLATSGFGWGTGASRLISPTTGPNIGRYCLPPAICAVQFVPGKESQELCRCGVSWAQPATWSGEMHCTAQHSCSRSRAARPVARPTLQDGEVLYMQ